ncbi:hypothetical protein KR074_007792 [Drosophila pseudoananassae]|nr:hypothetical protein KR074_007792 [Drosophila pseudoananassae]
MSRRRQWNPMFQVAKCETCTEQMDDTVTGLCVRCFRAWATVPPQTPSLNERRASVVRSTRDHSNNMSPTFFHVMQEAKNLRIQKDQNFRAHLQETVCLEMYTNQDPKPFVTGDDCYNLPEVVNDKDVRDFQKQVNLLEDMVYYNKALEELNKHFFFYHKSYAVIR